jgi:hypothetical protein
MKIVAKHLKYLGLTISAGRSSFFLREVRVDLEASV